VAAKLLSVIIPGRNEEFMRHTVDDVLAHSDESTEVICVADGYWPNPPLVQHPRLQVIHFGEAVGQRAATNYGAHLSRAKYVMKLDAHCSTDEGFDRKLLAKMQPDMTMIAAMRRLHAFDWVCECGVREYQGHKPEKCKECGGTEFTMAIVWQPRVQYPDTTSWLFDATIHFQYWNAYKHTEAYKREAPSGIVSTMSCIGCQFLMERKRFKWLGGFDERHGSWGNYGAELACKSWLSGGRMVTNLDTSIAHLFRTGNFARSGQSSWPYPITQTQIDAARNYSRDIWFNNKWEKQKYPLSWLLEKFWPIPGWTDDDLKRQKDRERNFVAAG
jgi:glycosyltransferase involved in cell wall biosynthesis